MLLPTHHTARRASAADDTPAQSARPWHASYSAVQCDLYPQLLMEQAMDIARQPPLEPYDARAWQAQRQRPLLWVLLVSLVVSCLGVWWLV